MGTAASGVRDPVDAESDDTPAWVDTVKELTRPAGCWATYLLTAVVIVALLGLLYLIVLGKLTVDATLMSVLTAVLTFVGTILGAGWAHAYQYTWARSGEKRVQAD